MTELRVVRAEGDPNARGERIGRELRDLINESLDFYHGYFARRGVSSRELQELLTPFLVAAETQFPNHVATLKGMAAGATVPVLELFAVNAFEELEPILETPDGATPFLQRKEGHVVAAKRSEGTPDRCTSFAVCTLDATFVAHSEHWLAGDLGNVAVVIDIPNDRPVRVASPTVASCLPAVGVNSHRAGVGVTSLTANDDRIGVPRVLASRHVLDSADRWDAIARADLPSRSGGYGYTFAFAGGDAFTLETTATRMSVLEERTHTNHYVDAELASIGAEPSEGSRARHDRVTELLATEPTTVEDVMEILRDHGSSPQAICLHPDSAEGDEASTVMFAMVGELEEGRMWVAAGNPCQNEFQEIDMDGVFGGRT